MAVLVQSQLLKRDLLLVINMKYNKGFFLIEVVVAASIISVVLILLLGSIQDSVEVSQRSLERTQSSYILEEGAEAVKAIRDAAWTNISGLTSGTTYYLSFNGTAWSLNTSTPDTLGAFSRRVVFADVYRDSNDDITTSGGTIDAGTKKVTITTNWTAPSGSKTESLDFYIANIR